jgi:hypothetical protein
MVGTTRRPSMRMTGKARYRRRWPRIVGWILLVVLFVTSGLGIYLFATRDTNPVPRHLQNDLIFSPLVIPKDSNRYTTTDYKFASAEEKVQILTYIIHTREGVAISVSEYTQPQQFAEIPEYKDRFLTNIAKQYATVQTANGVIYLGRMPNQNNRQLAVLLERGLIVFMTPDQEMDQARWRELGDEFILQKMTR